MSQRSNRIFVGLVLATLWSTAAYAGPLAGVTWNGATFTVELTSYDTASKTYNFSYVADFSGGSFDFSDHTDYLTGINFKPAQGNLTGGTLTGFSIGGASVGTSTWLWNTDANLQSTPGGTGGCDAKGTGNDFFCAIVNPFATNWNLYSTSGTPTYTWTFSLNIDGVTDPASLVFGAPIRASFSDGANRNGTFQNSLLSETTSAVPVPDPGVGVLLALGALTSFAVRRRVH